MSSQSSIALSSVDQLEFLAFHRDFEKHVEDLSVALAQSRAVSASATEIKNKGTWSTVWGSVNGKNDKTLADMTSSLAASLTVTQTVLQMVMSLNHRKNGFLKQFHEVLVNKISSLSSDTKTLDGNQREATMAILEEIENHVSGQLAQQEMVEQHQARLERVDHYIGAADVQADDFRNKLAVMEANAAAQRALIDEQRAVMARQAQHNDELGLALAALQSRMTAQVNLVRNIDAEMKDDRSVKNWLLRNALPFAALALAAISLL